MQEKLFAFLEANREQHLEMAFRLMRQKSISATGEGVADCALLLQSMMEEAGVRTEILTTPGNPLIFGEVNVGAPFTVLIYGHYDVQPPEPFDAWLSPPFEPTVRDGRIWCRGAGDNKGQLMANLLGVRAYLKTGTPLPVNVKFCFEGEEESSSAHLAWAVEQYKEKLACDMVYTSDGPQHPTSRPTVLLGVRGILDVQVDCDGAEKDQHSGNKGGAVPNPAYYLMQAMTRFYDGAQHKIAIPGFYDRVRPVLPYEQELLSKLPWDPEGTARASGMPSGFYADADPAEFYARTIMRPTLNINGLGSGYTGQGTKTIIPGKATVKIDMRLVVDQDPTEIYDLFVKHLRKVAEPLEQEGGVRFSVKRMGDMEPSRTPGDRPEAQAIIRAVEQAYGEEPVVMPGLGGSLPDYVWTRILGVPSVIVPYANPDEANHSPNENISLDCFFNGIRCAAAVVAELGKLKA
jgi:acetylornithine deacetylase/succinyl-diaminopimelate desuccinylase-like protein